MDAGKDWLPSPEDQLDLKHLVRQLGGHPLSMRTVLTGFLRLPSSKRKRNRPFAYILQLLKGKGLQEFSTQQADVYSADERSETILRTNFIATFRWLYDGLNQPDAQEVERLAYYLLPIAAIVGTESFTAEQVEKGLTALTGTYKPNADGRRIPAMSMKPDDQEHFPDDSSREGSGNGDTDQPPVWLVVLNEAKGNQSTIEEALECLEEIALVQYGSASSTYSMHPVIREFALALEDERQINFPSAETLLRTGISICGENTHSDTLLDLLPRLKGNRQLIEQAASLLKKQWHGDLYYSPQASNWKMLRAWAEEILSLTIDMGLHTTRAWVQRHLGELLDRMGYEEGLPMILDGFRSIEIEKDKDRADQVPQWEDFNFEAAIKLCTKADEGSIWSALYLLTEKFHIDSEPKFRSVYALFREKVAGASDGPSLGRLLSALFEGVQSVQGRMSSHAGGFDASCSNNYLNLGHLYQRFALAPPDGQTTDRAERIFGEITVDWLQQPTYELGKDAQEENKRHYRGISPQHWIYTRLHHGGHALLTGLISIEEFSARTDRLRQLALAQGIRAFSLEATSAQYRGYWHLERHDWFNASACFKSSQSAIAQISQESSSNLQWAQSIRCLLVTSTTLERQVADPVELSFLLDLNSRPSKSFCKSDEAFLHLALACIYRVSDHLSDCLDSTNRVVALFNSEYGDAPKFVLAIIHSWIARAAPLSTPEKELSWHIDWMELPQRVLHATTNRTMRLVLPGMEFGSSGKEEVCLWPFYIDEEPLMISDLVRWSDEKGFVVSNKNESNGSYLLGESTVGLTQYLLETNTFLPTEMEIFAAWLQDPGERQPERWLDHHQANLEELNRIENNLRTGALRERIWSEYIPFAASNQFSALGERNSEKVMKPGVTEKGVDIATSYEHIYTGSWFKYSPIMEARYREMCLEKFLKSEVMDEKKADEFGCLLGCSISLSLSEKKKIIDAIETLTRETIDGLLRIFREEYEKFIGLDNMHGAQLLALAEKHQQDWITILGIYEFSSISEDQIDSWHLLETDSKRYGWRSGDNAPTSDACVRCVRPIFTRADLVGLQSIQ